MKLRERTGTMTMGSLTHIKLMNTWWRKSCTRLARRVDCYSTYRLKNTAARYCFLTTSSKSVTVLYTFTFAYSMLGVIDELLTDI